MLKFKRVVIVFVVASLILVGCGTSSSDDSSIQTAIAQTQGASTSAEEETVSEEGDQEPVPTNTPRPSATPKPPTNTPEPTDAPSTSDLWSKNYVGSFESSGVIIEIARVVVGYKSAMPEQNWDAVNDFIRGWEETEVVGELIFKVTNNTESTVNIYPDQGTVQVAGEQIDLFDYAIATSFGDDVGGEIHPGVTKIGGLWFGIKRSTPEEVNQMIFRCSGPSDAETFSALGPDIEIVMEFPQHVYEEVPEELK